MAALNADCTIVNALILLRKMKTMMKDQKMVPSLHIVHHSLPLHLLLQKHGYLPQPVVAHIHGHLHLHHHALAVEELILAQVLAVCALHAFNPLRVNHHLSAAVPHQGHHLVVHQVGENKDQKPSKWRSSYSYSHDSMSVN